MGSFTSIYRINLRVVGYCIAYRFETTETCLLSAKNSVAQEEHEISYKTLSIIRNSSIVVRARLKSQKSSFGVLVVPHRYSR